MRFANLVRSTAVVMGVLVARAPLGAQDAYPTSPQFVEILRLAQDGRADSARKLITAALESLSPASAEYPEALFTAATIAKTGDESRLQFSRVAVDYSNSSWADKALLRLAQLDYGTANLAGTVARVRRLFSEYPSSSILPQAALWGARAAIDLRDLAQACEWLDRGLDRVGPDVETRNQLAYTRQRCPPAGTPIPIQPPAPTVDTVRPPVVANSNAERPWRVQVAAISDAAAISRLEAQIRTLGLTPYRVAGPNGLTKVQAGPFATREAAQARMAELRSAAGGAPFIVRIE
jgi:hypothetical protein